ncbi:phage/plasmid replication protein [Pseudomonas coronafaciens]|uniref:phage/plasmid replication domain-containing protein n=1 Tax=Pseudomonas coronafaciens TaxID=53409 RepID=UPI001CC208C0
MFLSSESNLTIKLLDIPDILLSQGIVSSLHAANATFVYVVRWMEGSEFDLAKSAVKVHRARLRKIGLDISKPFSGEVVSKIAKSS